MNFDFRGKTILVNGAASGMGKHTALMLSSYGAKVILVDVDEGKLQETVKTLDGEGHIAYQLDLSNLDNADGLIIPSPRSYTIYLNNSLYCSLSNSNGLLCKYDQCLFFL